MAFAYFKTETSQYKTIKTKSQKNSVFVFYHQSDRNRNTSALQVHFYTIVLVIIMGVLIIVVDIKKVEKMMNLTRAKVSMTKNIKIDENFAFC